MVTENAKGSEVSQMNEKIAGNNSAHTRAVPEVLDDPLRNRGVAFTVPMSIPGSGGPAEPDAGSKPPGGPGVESCTPCRPAAWC